jgi:hypothetical protein
MKQSQSTDVWIRRQSVRRRNTIKRRSTMTHAVLAIIPGGGPPNLPPPSNVPEVNSIGLLISLAVAGGAYRLLKRRPGSSHSSDDRPREEG